MKTLLTVGNKAVLNNAPVEVADKVKQDNTLPNPEYVQAQKYGRYSDHLDKDIELWRKGADGTLAFPRGYARRILDLLKKHGINPDIVDQRRLLEPIDLEFKGMLRGYQELASRDIEVREFGVAELPTGAGKTVIALSVIAKRRQPTIIIVHTKELLHQWADRIRSFLGVEPGLIGDGKFVIRSVTVALVHTARKHLDELPEHFGHVVVDECHRTPSTMFTETVQAFDSKYMLGLSATPYRRDGLSRLIYLTLGDRVHRADPEDIKANGAVLSPKVVTRQTSFRYSYSDDYPQMISALAEDPGRNALIAADVSQQATLRPGTCLVVSDRVAHCQTLAGIIESDSDLQVQVLTGSTPMQERKQIVDDVQAGNVDVLVSTLSLLSEGFDCSGLSSLFLATPIKFKGRLLQVVGRILRPSDGKRPVVYDYQDREVGVLRAQARTRSRALEEIAA